MDIQMETFRVYSNYKELLIIRYKDYMRVSAIENRIGEVVRITKRLICFDKK